MGSCRNIFNKQNECCEAETDFIINCEKNRRTDIRLGKALKAVQRLETRWGREQMSVGYY